ncbi:MAG: dehydrogenase, partial [gamma proteobacterium symbiont of Ctena orbiculata]
MTKIQSKTPPRPTACILCSINCGISVEVNGGKLQKIKGDKENPKSKGYICQKAARLNYYQNHSGRLSQPLSKKEDGEFQKISWDDAISEVADKLAHIHSTYGPHSIAYYGGGGQGNHLCQIYSSSLRSAIGTPYLYTALAQEKTGDFWVNGKLFGRQSCHVTEDIDHADYILFIGTNPYHSHGFPRARRVLDEIAKAPDRTMVVIDPVLTETAKKADIHLQLKPGTDALLMSAMLGTIIQDGLEDRGFIEEHTEGFDEIKALFNKIP